MTDKQKASNESPLCWVRPATTTPDLGGFQVCREGEGFPVWAHPNGMDDPVSAEPVGEIVLFGRDSDLKEVSWRKGKMPPPGAKLYAAPVAAQAQPITAADAVYGLLAWLSGRDEVVTLSARHGAAIAADLAKAFCEENGLQQFSQDYPDNLKYPKSAQAQQPASGADGLPTDTEFDGWTEDLSQLGYNANREGVEAYLRQIFSDRAALAQQDADPLQVAADWLVKDCAVSDAVELASRLSIGYNRASRLLEAACKEAGQ